MPDAQADVIKYTNYFNIRAPSTALQTLLLLLLGTISGLCSGLIIHWGSSSLLSFVTLGAGAGVMAIAIPSILAGMTIKAIRWKIRLKHIMFAVFGMSFTYAAILVAVSLMFSVSHNYAFATVLLVLANAGMYAYWFFMNRIALGLGKSAIFVSVIQPLFNLLFYVPFGKYLFTLDVPLVSLLEKLYAGMLVFLVISYLIVYLLDRPSKKMLSMSGLAIFGIMVQQWLFNVTPNSNLAVEHGVYRDVDVKVMSLKGKAGPGAVFVKPDIHYGPFASVGGSVAPEALGSFINSKYGAAPFVLHGAVNAGDNPISAQQIVQMKKSIGGVLDTMYSKGGSAVRGTLSIGAKGPCRAINLKLNEVNVLTLSKAPLVTEDIDRDIGHVFESAANPNTSKVVLIDAHNSRFESASKDELRGIYKTSKYVSDYKEAIASSSAQVSTSKPVSFGSACRKLRHMLPNAKDMGNGFTSAGVFSFGGKKFAMLYFDSNNMLPSFRSEVLEHIRKKFGLRAELYTTDTHAVNTIALPASNALGRYTKAKDVMPLIDDLMSEAISRIEHVSLYYESFTIKRFKVWGEGADEMIIRASKEAIRTFKHVVPFVAAAGFVIAAWIIYIV